MASNPAHFARPPTFRNPFGMMMAFHWILPPKPTFFYREKKKLWKNAGTGRKTIRNPPLGFFRESFRNPPCAGKNFGWVKNLPTKKDLSFGSFHRNSRVLQLPQKKISNSWKQTRIIWRGSWISIFPRENFEKKNAYSQLGCFPTNCFF